MNWQPEIDELHQRERLAHHMGGKEKVAKHHAQGRLTVRERIEALFDTGTFHEIGALAGTAEYNEGQLTEFRPANFVFGKRTSPCRAITYAQLLAVAILLLMEQPNARCSASTVTICPASIARSAAPIFPFRAEK